MLQWVSYQEAKKTVFYSTSVILCILSLKRFSLYILGYGFSTMYLLLSKVQTVLSHASI